jgi:tetratricopeptide (TPR) repeat protein
VVTKFLGGEGDEVTPAIPSKLSGMAQNTVVPPANAPATNAATPAVPSGPGASEFIAQARTAMGSKEYYRATTLFQQALLLERENGEALTGLDEAKAFLAKQQEAEARNQKFIKDYQFAIGAFRDGEYKDSLTIAWRLIYPDDKLADELGKRNAIRRLLRDGYFNWAVKDLKVGNAREAEKNLGEVLTIEANDAQAKNLKEFAGKYAGQPPDDLYWATVRTLTPRPFQEHQ